MRIFKSVFGPDHRLCPVFPTGLCFLFPALGLLSGCNESPQQPAQAAPVDVTVVETEARDTPIVLEFVAKTASSRRVEIRSRVEGFLEERLYTEGALVEPGQPLFQMDKKPFEAQLQAAKGCGR